MSIQIAESGLAVLAGIYLQAADELERRGYTAFADAGEPGISVREALRYAAAAHIEAAITTGTLDGLEPDTYLLAEDLETRLAGIMYVLGQLRTRTSIADLPDLVSWWEKNYCSHPPHDGPHGYPSQDEAVALLKTAAAMTSTAAGA